MDLKSLGRNKHYKPGGGNGALGGTTNIRASAEDGEGKIKSILNFQRHLVLIDRLSA